MRAAITPCFWYERDSLAAAALVQEAFGGGRTVDSNPMSTVWELFGRRVMGINGGPRYRPGSSLSLFVQLPGEVAVRRAFETLARDGRAHLPLAPMPWSPLFAWVEDRHGVHWQLAQSFQEDSRPMLFPTLMFTGPQAGQARAAIDAYTKVFPGSSIGELHLSDDGGVRFAIVELAGQTVGFMDGHGGEDEGFTPGVSLSVACDDQAEIDHFWDHLVQGGQESRCGWLTDRFGFSWQIVPSIMGELMSDPQRAQRVVAAFLPMTRLDLETLRRA